MEPFKPRVKKGPEAKIQAAIVKKLKLLGWHVMETHGNVFQKGLPDLFACHKLYGQRWIEVKNASAYCFTAAQKENFPKMCSNGAPIWILVSDSDSEIQKLYGKANLWVYWK